MKKIILTNLLLLTSLFFLYSQGSNDYFNLIFEENFEVDGNPNSQYWDYCPRRSPDWAKYLVENNSETVEVKEGKLFLRAIKNTDLTSDNVPYLTGGIKTEGKVGIKYGKVEVSAKVPEGQGSFPAIWMMPTNATYGGWPYSGEIDIMEHLNYDNFVYHTIHSYYASNTPYGMSNKNPAAHTTSSYNKNQFNIYSLEWYPDKLVFKVNGNQSFVYPRLTPSVQYQWPYDHEFYLILNTACNGSWGGAVNNSHLPFEMEIDWVKMYELDEDLYESSYNIPSWGSGTAYNDSKLNDTYVTNITTTGTIEPLALTFDSKPESYYTLINQPINVNSDTDFSINLQAYSLGEYSESIVLQDLRYTCVYAYADFDGDLSFETTLARVGNQKPTHNVGGNIESLNVNFNFKAPNVTEVTNGRIRVVYHNAWSNHANADAAVSEGLVYDFNLKIKPVNASVHKVGNFQPSVRRYNENLIIDGLSSGAMVSVYDFTGKLISNKQISSNSATLNIPQQFVLVKIQSATGEIFSTKL